MALGQFQATSLAIAILILVVTLSIMAIVLAKSTDQYPPEIEDCPDYWTTSNYLHVKDSKCKNTEFGCCSDYATPKTSADGSNCPVKCYNTHQLGTVSSTCTSKPVSMDFSEDMYKGTSGICNKRKWATQCGVTWDGITNISHNC